MFRRNWSTRAWLAAALLSLAFGATAARRHQRPPPRRPPRSQHAPNSPRSPMGCFWCGETQFETLPGVKSVISGYSGGREERPTYEQVSSGETGHYEPSRSRSIRGGLVHEAAGHVLARHRPDPGERAVLRPWPAISFPWSSYMTPRRRSSPTDSRRAIRGLGRAQAADRHRDPALHEFWPAEVVPPGLLEEGSRALPLLS
jgi:hypothetical protein